MYGEGLRDAVSCTGMADASGRFYVMSVILGTVAFSYGSVPLYKMVRSQLFPSLVYSQLMLSLLRSAKLQAGVASQSAPTSPAPAPKTSPPACNPSPTPSASA